MESQSQKIITFIEKILPLLEVGNIRFCLYYRDYLKNILLQLNKPHELDKIASDIQRIYGGMATFNDIVLYQDGKIMADETERFEELREELYLACEEAILTFRK